MSETIRHPIPPYVPKNSRVLILGTMPSPKSREAGFYYMHPQTRFWPTLAGVFGEAVPCRLEARKAFLDRHGIALWDVLATCRIEGASDASIRDAVANDIPDLLLVTGITRVFTTGSAAAGYYKKLVYPLCGVEAAALPSPSSANARMRAEELVKAYRILLEQ